MKQIEVSRLTENFFESIGKEWMIVCAGDEAHYNMMTASWGGIGWLWNKPVAFVFIRPERYTFEFSEKCGFMTLSFLGNSAEARQDIQLLRFTVGAECQQDCGKRTGARAGGRRKVRGF